MPLMNDLGALGSIAAWAHGKGNPFVVERHERFAIPMHDHHEMAPSPQGVTLAIYVLPGRLPRLVRQLLLLLPNPAEF